MDESDCWCGMDHAYMDMDDEGNWVEYDPDDSLPPNVIELRHVIREEF